MSDHAPSGPRWRRNKHCVECHQPWPCPTERKRLKEAKDA